MALSVQKYRKAGACCWLLSLLRSPRRPRLSLEEKEAHLVSELLKGAKDSHELIRDSRRLNGGESPPLLAGGGDSRGGVVRGGDGGGGGRGG